MTLELKPAVKSTDILRVCVCVCVCVSFPTGKAEKLKVRILKKRILKKSAILSFDIVNPVVKGLLRILQNSSLQSVYIVKIQEKEILR